MIVFGGIFLRPIPKALCDNTKACDILHRIESNFLSPFASSEKLSHFHFAHRAHIKAKKSHKASRPTIKIYLFLLWVFQQPKRNDFFLLRSFIKFLLNYFWNLWQHICCGRSFSTFHYITIIGCYKLDERTRSWRETWLMLPFTLPGASFPPDICDLLALYFDFIPVAETQKWIYSCQKFAESHKYFCLRIYFRVDLRGRRGERRKTMFTLMYYNSARTRQKLCFHVEHVMQLK